MAFPGFVYGTQYYRAPTPTPDEWDGDLARIRALGLNTVQLRVQWRQNERREDAYVFDDIDRLFDLAERRNLAVVFKFLMETAPDYIFERYGALRHGLDGAPIRPGAHGAFYVGGWGPCFDHPDAVRRAERFVAVAVARYRDRPGLMFWNLWNEPRAKPIGECCCPYSIQSYRDYLRDRFGDVERLNAEYGKAWESFDTVRPPGMAHDYAELHLWRQWSWRAVTARLAFMAAAVRRADPTRPVVSHVGACNMLQDAAADGSDDLANARVCDRYGTSFPVPERFDDAPSRAFPFFVCDWMRSVDEKFWVYELYPEWGDWGERADPAAFRYKVLSALAGGAKGLLFWQYRAERLGMENDLAGLVNIDGSPKAVTAEAARLAPVVAEHADFLARARVLGDPVGVVYSRLSDLASRVENTGIDTDGLHDFALRGSYTYKYTLQGAYTMLHELGYTPELVDDRLLPERLARFKVLYLPAYYIVSPEAERALLAFAAAGGRLIAEDGLALRRDNTWLRYPWPGGPFADLFGVRVESRFATRKTRQPPRLRAGGRTVAPGDYWCRLQAEVGAKPAARWSDGSLAAVERDGHVFVGTDLGLAYHRHREAHGADCLSLLSSWLPPPALGRLPEGVAARRLAAGRERLLFVFNQSRQPFAGTLDGQAVAVEPGGVLLRRYEAAREGVHPHHEPRPAPAHGGLRPQPSCPAERVS